MPYAQSRAVPLVLITLGGIFLLTTIVLAATSGNETDVIAVGVTTGVLFLFLFIDLWRHNWSFRAAPPPLSGQVLQAANDGQTWLPYRDTV